MKDGDVQALRLEEWKRQTCASNGRIASRLERGAPQAVTLHTSRFLVRTIAEAARLRKVGFTHFAVDGDISILARRKPTEGLTVYSRLAAKGSKADEQDL